MMATWDNPRLSFRRRFLLTAAMTICAGVFSSFAASDYHRGDYLGAVFFTLLTAFALIDAARFIVRKEWRQR